MKVEDVTARVEAVQYIIDNKLYNEDMEDELYGELETLKNELLEYPEDTETESEAESILKQRKSQYGDYNTFIVDMRSILNILTARKEYSRVYTDEDVENFFFVLKLLRLQTAKDLDSLIDLSNYAKLAKDRRDRINS
jgi:vacuolar-type H+-ATPase subunit H